MSRVIKFRALKDDMSNCTFVYGQLVYDAIGNPRIVKLDFSGDGLQFNSCIKGTEGQYTGRKDFNNVDIYEGDILYHHGLVAWSESELRWSRIDLKWNEDKTWSELDSLTSPFIVIGNIHENPELNPKNETT